MPVIKEKSFSYPNLDHITNDKQRAAIIDYHIKIIRDWLKDKRFKDCHMIEKDGVVTFTYTEKTASE